VSTTAAKNETPAAAGSRPETKYIVLKLVEVKGDDDKAESWEIVGKFKAVGGKDAALKKWVGSRAEAERVGSYKAVAESAWNGGFKAATKQVTQTEFEEIA
jgi:hypothetical protein